MHTIPLTRVFLSSPADVTTEREIADRVIARLDGIWQAHVRLSAVRWERHHYEAARSFQEAIGAMSAYDIVIGIVWKRIGSELAGDSFSRPDGSPYESGTVFEIETALASSNSSGRPKVYAFRCTRPVTFAAGSWQDDQRQYEALTGWWNRTFRDEAGHYRRGYHEFATSEQFEQILEKLLEAYLREAGLIPSGPAWDVATKGSPYPGLLPYDRDHSNVFFGRALAVAGALEELKAAAARETPALFIVGPSGSGKSSLARAGLVPYFRGAQIAGIDFWRYLLIEPAKDGIAALAQRLYAQDALPELATGPQSTPQSLAVLLRQAPDAAAEAVKWALGAAARAEHDSIGGGKRPVGKLLIVLDQMETVLDDPDRQTVAAFLRAVVQNEASWLIATLRSDRYADLQLDPDFMAVRRRGALFDLPPPGPSEIADIIRGPARAASLAFEEKDGVSLAKRIGAAVSGADALPLLQMTLAQLFETRERDTLTYAAYEAMGELEGAIAAHADDVFRSVTPEGQARLDAVLRQLVADIDDNGRLTIRTPERSAVASDPASQELVTKMTEGRLLAVADGGVRVAHEALLRRWQRAAESPALQPAAIRLRRQIEPSFKTWQATGKGSDLLPSGTTLAAAETIVCDHPGALPPEIDGYVRLSVEAARSRAQADVRRARRRAYVAIGVAAMLASLGLMVFRLYNEASHNFTMALLTKADQLLVEEKPTQAALVAGSLVASDAPHKFLSALGLAPVSNDEAVRIKTIARIAGPASSIPLRTFKREHGATAVEFSPDGKRFAVGYGSGDVILFKADGAGPEIHLQGHHGRVGAVRFSPDGRWLASTTGTEVLLWDLAEKRVRPVCDRESSITDVSFDPAGHYLAWTTKDGRVSLWDRNTGARTSFADHKRWALAIDFSADGTLLASSGDDGVIVVRDTKDWSVRRRIVTGRVDLVGLSFSPDGKRIATASLAGPVDVWTLDHERPETSGIAVTGPNDKRWKVRFSPDGRWLAVASWNGSVRMLDGATLQYRGTIDGNDHRINGAAFASDSSRLLTAAESGAVRLWDLASLHPMFDVTPDNARETIIGAYSRDGTRFLTGGKDGLARIYRVDDQGSLHFVCAVEHRNWVIGAAFSPDGKEAVSIGLAEGEITEDVIKRWDTKSCRIAETALDRERRYVQGIAYSPVGRRVAWATRSGQIWISDLDANVPPTPLPQVHTAIVAEMDFSPDGKYLVSGGRDRRVIVWDVAAKTVFKELRGHSGAVNTAKFSPTGNIVASGGSENQILVWDITRADPLITTLGVKGGVNRLAFNASGTVLAVGSDARYISMWSVGNWEKIFQLNTLVGVRSVFGFHPVRGDLAFDGENGMVRVLPQTDSTSARPPSGELRGMDAHFDDMPANINNDGAAGTIRLDGPACS